MHHGTGLEADDGGVSMTQPDDDARYAQAAEDARDERESLDAMIDTLSDAMHHGASLDAGLSMTAQAADDALFVEAAEAMAEEVTDEREWLDALIDGLTGAMRDASSVADSENRDQQDTPPADTERSHSILDRMVDSLVAASERHDSPADECPHAPELTAEGGIAADAADFIAAAAKQADQDMLDGMVDSLMASVGTPTTDDEETTESQSFDPLELNVLE